MRGETYLSSFNTHKRFVLNAEEPLNFRYSHLRSCVNKVANLLRLRRQEVIEMIRDGTGVDVDHNASEQELLIALDFLENQRNTRLGREPPGTEPSLI